MEQDRVVVTSPGTLPNTLTPESVQAGGHPRSRNELFANYMATMGMMEQHNATEPGLQEDRAARFLRVTMQTLLPEEE